MRMDTGWKNLKHGDRVASVDLREGQTIVFCNDLSLYGDENEYLEELGPFLVKRDFTLRPYAKGGREELVDFVALLKEKGLIEDFEIVKMCIRGCT